MLPRAEQAVAVVGESEGFTEGLMGETDGFTVGDALREEVGATLGVAVVISVRADARFAQYSLFPNESTTDICSLPVVNWNTWKYPYAPTLPALDPRPHALVANFRPLGQATDVQGTSTGSHLSEAEPDPMWFTPPFTICCGHTEGRKEWSH